MQTNNKLKMMDEDDFFYKPMFTGTRYELICYLLQHVHNIHNISVSNEFEFDLNEDDWKFVKTFFTQKSCYFDPKKIKERKRIMEAEMRDEKLNNILND